MAITLDGSNLTTSGVINRGTAVASTSGTSIDFTGIPIGASRITVMFSGVSTSGTSDLQIQIGAGSFTTSGYTSSYANITGTNTTTIGSATSGFIIRNGVVAASSYSGIHTLNLITGNTFVNQGQITNTSGNGVSTFSSGFLALGGTLDRVRITTVNGTDTFDAGTINILYE
jgi:hypothetical protein